MATSAGQPHGYDGYSRLREEVKRRWKAPRSHPTYMLFFIGSLWVFAAAGIWLEVVKLALGIGDTTGSPAAIRSAIATYFPAILGSCALQLAISDTLRSLRALGQIVGYFFLFVALSLIFASNLSNCIAISVGILSSIGALCCWWVVNADDDSLLDDAPPDAATGGKDATGPLLGGSALSEFEV